MLFNRKSIKKYEFTVKRKGVIIKNSSRIVLFFLQLSPFLVKISNRLGFFWTDIFIDELIIHDL
jgi:hypothetical protein